MNQLGSSDQIFNLKVPDSQKTKEWYEEYINYIVPYNEAYVEDSERLRSNYQIYNGDLSTVKQFTKEQCDPLGIYQDLDIDEELIAYPKLHNMVSILEGEKLKRREQYKVLIQSARAIQNKNEKLLEAIQSSVDERVTLKIEKLKKQMEGMPPSEIDSYIQELKTQESPEDILNKNFLSEHEIFYNKALKYCRATQDTKTKQMLTLKDNVINARFFLYSGWKHGVPVIEERNMLHIKHHKAPNEFRVHKGDWIAYIDAITPADVLDEYMEELTEENIENLGFNKTGLGIKDKRHSILGNAKPINQLEKDADLLTDLYDNNDRSRSKYEGLNQTQEYTQRHLVYRTHFEFKAFKPVIFLTYNDEMGEIITIIVKDDYDIPENADKIKFTNKFGTETYKYVWMEDDVEYSAERIWIPRKYEVTRLNNGIIVRYREVPYQVTNIENPYASFSLSTKGAIFNARNAKSISLFERALPLYYQQLFIKSLQNRELAKYKGYVLDIDVDQIPESLGKDADGELINDPIKVALAYQKYGGYNFYSSSKSSHQGLPSPQRSPGSQGQLISTAMEIFNLQQLIELIDQEMSMTMGISPQRKADFSSNTNVSDNQQAIAQSHHITEPLFYMHSVIWADVFKDYLHNFRTYAERVLLQEKEKHTLEYFLEDGTKELLEITQKGVELLDIMVFPTNSGNDLEYQNLMKQYAQAFSQNPEGVDIISALLKSITSGASAEETHKLILIEKRKQEERMAQEQERSNQLQERMAQIQKETTEDMQAHEIEKIIVKGEIDKQIAAMNNTARSEEKDADKDGIPDYLEIFKAGVEAEIKKEQIELEKSKLQSENEHKDKDRRVKEKELAIKKNSNSN
jgi:hypothetical protein